MLIVDLNQEEQEVLRIVLESYLSDLRMEISHTDSWDFREHLKERKAVIIKVLDSLPMAEVTV